MENTISDDIPKYQTPPVVEALFDIKTELSKEISPLDLEALHSQLIDVYPTKRVRRAVQTNFELKEGQPPSAETKDLGTNGYLFWSVDEKQVVQYRMDGFSYSRLQPYQKWEQRLPEAKRLWDIYQKTLKPITVTRLALRYINKIDFAEGCPNDYLKYPPSISASRIDKVIEFFSRTVFDTGNSDIKVILTQGANTMPQGQSSLLLDIDVFANVQLKPESDQIWNVFAALRKQSNEIFEESITPKAKESFK